MDIEEKLKTEDFYYVSEYSNIDVYYDFDESEEIYNNYLEIYPGLDLTYFRDENFRLNFFLRIPKEEWEKYFSETIKYLRREKCNHDYVLVTRRAIPSEQPKPEVFWSYEFVPLYGLKTEIINELRLHSVIMVSTLGKLENHGLSRKSRGAVSDGEIVIDPNKPFSDFLFTYKPFREIRELEYYLKNGGITREEILNKLSATAYGRAILQGLDVDKNGEFSDNLKK